MIQISGFPKSGNHLLKKACELLGVTTSEVDHIPYADGLPDGTTQHLFIRRDPRHVVISMLNFQGIAVTDASFLAMVDSFNGDTLVNGLNAYAGWLTDANTFVTSFEALQSSPAEMQRMAAYLGVFYPGNFSQLEGLTLTYTSSHADYTTIWTPDLESQWNSRGGAELLTAWGY
jgi:hypothetical protein